MCASRGLCAVAGLLMLVVTPLGQGAYRLRQWNYNIPSSKYTLDEYNKAVYIHEGDMNCFKFEACDSSNNSPQEIVLIKSFASGRVHVTVDGDQSYGRYDGATNVREIDLLSASEAAIETIDIAGNLGDSYLSFFDSVGSVWIGGNLLDTLWSYGGITRLEIDGTLSAAVRAQSGWGTI